MAQDSWNETAKRLRALTPDQRALLARLAADRGERRRPDNGTSIELHPLPRAHTAGALPEFPVSYSQQRLWLLEHLSPDLAAYNIPVSVPIRGRISEPALERAINAIVARHEALRTTFDERAGEPVQIVHPPSEMKLDRTDLIDEPPAQRAEAARRIAANELGLRFDLQHGPLLRARLVRVHDEEHLLLLTIHHIAFDGWSAGLLLRELNAWYAAAVAGSPNPLRPMPCQYADYSVWQRNWIRSAEAKAQSDFWLKQLMGMPVLALPTDRPRPAVSTFRGGSFSFSLPPALTRAMREYGQREGVTLFMTLIAAFASLLARYARQDDIPIGTYSLGRNRADLETMIGCFLNTMVLRIRLEGNPTFAELVRKVRQTALDAYANQDVPFEMVLQSLEREGAGAPPFAVTFQYLNVPTLPASPKAEQDSASAVPEARGVAAFDLAVTVSESGGDLAVQIEYSTDLFDAATIEQMAGHYRRLLAGAVASPSRPVRLLSILSEEERHQVVYGWNETRQVIPQLSVAALFEAQAERTPDAVAFIQGDRTVSYRELRCRVNQLCNFLSGLGAAPRCRIGVMLERSIDAIAAILGTFKLDAAYVPLDPAYPAERLAFMIETAQLDFVLVRGSCAGPALLGRSRVVRIDECEAQIESAAAEYPCPPADPERPAYILFTSGSTGKPKGVVASENQILNRLYWMWHDYPFGAAEVSCHKTALSFIDSLWEIFGALLVGVPTVIMANDEVKDSDRLLGTLQRHKVTRLWLVPALLQTLVDTYPDLHSRLPELSFWVSSGEVLSAELYARFRAAMPAATLYNLYGTSEVWDVTWHTPDAATAQLAHIPIGKPIWNMRTYVLDADGQPQPPSVWGELYVAGLGVGIGYLNSPEWNAERFLPDPFVPGERMYRTGDLARWSRDGTIEYLGRADRQVKVRGHRVELEEVERVLAECPAVSKVAVIVAGGGAQASSLVAYVAPKASALSQSNLAATVRDHARSRLPEYMTPARVLVRRELPLTPSGKVDRTALAKTQDDLGTRASAYVAPVNDVERAIARIWAEVLEVERVSTDQDFFDLGGHSLAAMRAVSRINQEFSVNLLLPALFNASTLAQLAATVAALCADHSAGASAARSGG